MAPRVSGGVAHAMAISADVGADVRVVCASAACRDRGADMALIVAHFVRTIWSRSCGNAWSANCTRSARNDAPDAVSTPRQIAVRVGVHDAATIWTTGDALAITHVMFDLCSAPCKARRFAPPAHARGLRALTVPARSSRMGNCVMAGGVMTCNVPILSIDLGSKRRYSVVISPVQQAPLPRGNISRGTLNVVALRATTRQLP